MHDESDIDISETNCDKLTDSDQGNNADTCHIISTMLICYRFCNLMGISIHC